MKILAIRGENLASLDGTFSVDLTAEPLGRAGLFAITGPTGAGKSTLLDAICLCLYDTTPRLADRGGSLVSVDGEADATALRANDERNILRRGTGAGWAEVDFTGRDGRGFTARWEVRRARRSPTGKVQPQEWSLRTLGSPVDQPLVAGKKTEVEAAIRQEVGLDFAQFRRSVLLAQGDFAAFLKASENDRAVLLEQMTGSAIYSRLSRAAHDSARRLRTERAKLEIQLGEHTPSKAEARAEAEKALEAAAQTRTQAAAIEKAAEAAVAWHTRQAELDAQLKAAEQARTQAAQAVNAAVPRKTRLARIARAWPIRALASELAQAQAASNAAAQACSRAVAHHTRVEAARVQAESARNARLGFAAAAWAGRRDQLAARLAGARQGQERCAAWLDARQGVARLCGSEEFGRLVGEKDRPGKLHKRRELATRVVASEARAQTLRGAALAAKAELSKAQNAHQQAVDALEKRRAARTAAESAATAAEALVPPTRAAQLVAERRTFAELAGLHGRVTDVMGRRAKAVALQAEHTARATQAQERSTTAQKEQAQLATRLGEAETALRRAQQAVNAEGLRAELEPDQPCSVCGSTTHPWAEGSPLARVFSGLEAQVQTLRTAQAAAAQAHASGSAAATAATEAAQRAGAQVAEADLQLQSLQRTWVDSVGGLSADAPLRTVGPIAEDPHAAARTAALAEFDTALTAREQALATDQAASRVAQNALSKARVDEQSALSARDAAAEVLQAAKQAGPKLALELQALEAETGELGRRVASIEAELAHTFDSLAPELEAWPEAAPLREWRDHLGQPEPVVEALRAVATTVARHTRRRAEAEARIAELAQALPVVQAQAEEAAREAQGCPEATVDVPDSPSAPPERTQWWTDTTTRASQAAQAARNALEGAVVAVQEAAQARAAAEATHQARVDTSTQLQARLSQQLAELQAGPELVPEVVALAADWPEVERLALDALDRGLAAALVREEERRAAWTAHATTRPAVDRREAETQSAAAGAARAAADEAWSQKRAAIDRDDRARGAGAALRARIDDHDATAAPWLQLAQCIGSASGQEFRKYAQSLTLELLLEQANDHLRRLHPRYRLARIAGTDLDILVIDGDLGDEARTVRSLSGGEGFLVSLALALGLSSLSARDVRVESLFIDEGFGTLDARSLDKALSVLDSLQSEGRQVGIISHVGGLAERIGVRVAVTPLGGGRSKVNVIG